MCQAFNFFPLFALLRYECLPERESNERFTRDNETNTDVLTPLYKIQHGVSATFILNPPPPLKVLNFLESI